MCCTPDGIPSTPTGNGRWSSLGTSLRRGLDLETATFTVLNQHSYLYSYSCQYYSFTQKYKKDLKPIWVFIFTGKLAEIVGPRGDTRFSAELTYTGFCSPSKALGGPSPSWWGVSISTPQSPTSYLLPLRNSALIFPTTHPSMLLQAIKSIYKNWSPPLISLRASSVNNHTQSRS